MDIRCGTFLKILQFNDIIETQTFKNVPLLISADRGRATRSQTCESFGYGRDGFAALVKSRFVKYSKFLKDAFNAIERQFEPWSTWLVASNDAFNFKEVKTDRERLSAFSALMDCKTMCGTDF